MSGIDGIVFEDTDNPVIKWDTVYTPNPSVCPGKKYMSFIEMQKDVGEKLEAASDYAHANNIPFVPYTIEYQIKPEFAHEISNADSGVQQMSDSV